VDCLVTLREESKSGRGSNSGSSEERAAEEFQRVARVERMEDDGDKGDNKGWKELKMRNCRPWSVDKS
jgi:hypothetical protein